jgi:hypothetical protein
VLYLIALEKICKALNVDFLTTMVLGALEKRLWMDANDVASKLLSLEAKLLTMLPSFIMPQWV